RLLSEKMTKEGKNPGFAAFRDASPNRAGMGVEATGELMAGAFNLKGPQLPRLFDFFYEFVMPRPQPFRSSQPDRVHQIDPGICLAERHEQFLHRGIPRVRRIVSKGAPQGAQAGQMRALFLEHDDVDSAGFFDVIDTRIDRLVK